MATTDMTTTAITEGQTLEMRLRVRLEELKANREKFMSEAQRQLAALDAAIGEMSALLDPPVAEQNGTSDEVPPA